MDALTERLYGVLGVGADEGVVSLEAVFMYVVFHGFRI
jgi:hypothetical protein